MVQAPRSMPILNRVVAYCLVSSSPFEVMPLLQGRGDFLPENLWWISANVLACKWDPLMQSISRS